jgi:uncharacterized protein YprB with RNaseH-like and TPR domain
MKKTIKKSERMIELYASSKKRAEVQEILAKEFCCATRTIRIWAKELGLNTTKAHTKNDRVLVYDIETSRVTAKLWSTGKQYVSHGALKSETTIISIAWKWIGEDKVHHVVWDENHNDKELLQKFLPEFNKASIVVGQNSKSFDNKIVAARAAKHRLFINNFVTNVDIYRLAKSVFRLPSYSMAYMAKYFGLTLKQSHEGIYMWDMIEDGKPKEQKEYLKKMVNYNVGDIVTTEELYMTLRPYFKHATHLGVKDGLKKWVCPNSGSEDVVLHDTKFTAAGTVQRILYCEDSNTQYKVSNKVYMDYLQRSIG